jgi:hypothetical protein
VNLAKRSPVSREEAATDISVSVRCNQV